MLGVNVTLMEDYVELIADRLLFMPGSPKVQDKRLKRPAFNSEAVVCF